MNSEPTHYLGGQQGPMPSLPGHTPTSTEPETVPWDELVDTMDTESADWDDIEPEELPDTCSLKDVVRILGVEGPSRPAAAPWKPRHRPLTPTSGGRLRRGFLVAVIALLIGVVLLVRDPLADHVVSAPEPEPQPVVPTDDATRAMLEQVVRSEEKALR